MGGSAFRNWRCPAHRDATKPRTAIPGRNNLLEMLRRLIATTQSIALYVESALACRRGAPCSANLATRHNPRARHRGGYRFAAAYFACGANSRACGVLLAKWEALRQRCAMLFWEMWRHLGPLRSLNLSVP